MRFGLPLIASLFALSASASPFGTPGGATKRENDSIQHLGSQSATLSGGTKFGDLVFVSGQVPLLNGTVVPGGIRNETAFVIERVGEILAEGGTDWSKVLKVTVLLQDIRDIGAMNEVYASMIPDPKPARATFEVGNLPVFGISIEMEAIAAA